MPNASLCQQEPALFRVPASEGEHAAQPTHCAWTVQAKRAQHDGRVAGGPELLPLGLQAPPQVLEVVDLAVEGDNVPGHRIDHRLIAGRREVENCQAAKPQHCPPAAFVRRGEPHCAAVRAAVDHRPVHALEGCTIGLVQSSDDPCNAAHQSCPRKKQTLNHICSAHLRPSRPFRALYQADRCQNDIGCKTTSSTSFWSSTISVRMPPRDFHHRSGSKFE